jgi:mannose-6-phosphate isomerase-like protein (cupin superfamily)
VKIYEKKNSHLFCGHWNGSPVEIGEGCLTAVPESEVRHKHTYHEYYVFLEGAAQLEVNRKIIPISAGMVIMVEPGEWHQIISISDTGARWIIIKERSEPNSKLLDNGSVD